MKKLLLALVLWPSLCLAQNPTCPTRPAGDSSNACASTAFVKTPNNISNAQLAQRPATTLMGNPTAGTANVQDMTLDPSLTFTSLKPAINLANPNTWTGAQTFNAVVTITPPSSLSQAINSSQTLSGSTSSSLNANRILLSDNVLMSGANFLNGLTVEHHLGTGFTGGRQGLLAALFIDGSPGVTGNGNYVAGTFQMQTPKNLGGTGLTFGTAGGAIFGANPYVLAQTGATNLLNVSGAEVDFGIQTGASSYAKFGWSVVALASDAVQGSVFDAGYELRGQTGSVGLKVGLLFDDLAGNAKFPVSTAGTLIAASTNGATTVANGIDFGGLTFTGNMLKFPGFVVNSAGLVQANNYQINLTPTTGWAEDATGGATVSIANGANAAIAAGNGLVVIEESVNSHTAIYLMSAGTGTLVSNNGTNWVAPTTTPAAGKASVSFNGTSTYNIYNNIGSTVTFTVFTVRLKTTA